MNAIRRAVAVAVLVLLTGTASAEELNMAGVKVNVIEKKLDNGLTLIMMENHQSPTIGLITQFKVGSVDEWDGISGAAHILEHLLFKGTSELGTTDWAKEKALLDQIETTAQELRRERSLGHRGDPARLKSLEEKIDALQAEAKGYVVPNELDRIYTENGGQAVNAGTSWDGTNYQVALPSNRLELWMKLESDRLKAPVLREFYTELKNIMEERRLRTEDDPTGVLGKLGEATISAAYTAHRYGVPIIGWPSDIAMVTRTEVEEFFTRYYAPNRMTLAIVGDIDPVKTHEMAEAYFGSIPRQPDPFQPRTIEPEQQGERRIVVEYDAEPRAMITWHVMDGLADDYPALLVLDDILTGGRSSRLNREIVEKQKIAASIGGYTGVPGERFPGLFMLEVVPLAPHTTADVEEAIYREIERLKKEPVTAEELNAAKTRYKRSFADGLVNNLGQASILAYNDATLGDWREGFRRADAVQKVTAADVQKVATLYLKKANRTVGTLVKPAAEVTFVDPAEREKAVLILSRAAQALGGPKALAAFKNMKTESAIKIHTPGGAIDATAKETITADGRTRSEVSVMGQQQVQVYDGDTGWMVTPAGATDATPEAISDMKESLARELFLITFTPGNLKGSVRVVSGASLDGKPTEAVEVTPVEGKSFVIHFDPATHLPAGMSFDSKNPLTGQPGRADKIYGAWKATAGIQFPGQSAFRMGGTTVLEETVNLRTVNAGVSPDEFKKPS